MNRETADESDDNDDDDDDEDTAEEMDDYIEYDYHRFDSENDAEYYHRSKQSYVDDGEFKMHLMCSNKIKFEFGNFSNVPFHPLKGSKNIQYFYYKII